MPDERRGGDICTGTAGPCYVIGVAVQCGCGWKLPKFAASVCTSRYEMIECEMWAEFSILCASKYMHIGDVNF